MIKNGLAIILLTLIVSFLAGGTGRVYSQSRLEQVSGTISFFSSTPIEDIKAENSSFTSVINPSDSSILFTVQIARFVFPKRLMQQHFNEQYMESNLFPEAVFRGKILNPLPPFDGDTGKIKTRVKGKITIRGIENELDEEVILTRTADEMDALTLFILRPADFGIRIPRILRRNIAEEIEVTIRVKYSVKSER